MHRMLYVPHGIRFSMRYCFAIVLPFSTIWGIIASNDVIVIEKAEKLCYNILINVDDSSNGWFE